MYRIRRLKYIIKIRTYFKFIGLKKNFNTPEYSKKFILINYKIL